MRQQALEWWRNMPIEDRKRLAKKHAEKWSFEMVSNSLSIIERIHLNEELL